MDNIYKVPLTFRDQGVDDFVLEHFGLEAPASELSKWTEPIERSARAHARFRSRWSASTCSSRTLTCRCPKRCATPASLQDASVQIDWIDSESLEGAGKAAPSGCAR